MYKSCDRDRWILSSIVHRRVKRMTVLFTQSHSLFYRWVTREKGLLNFPTDRVITLVEIPVKTDSSVPGNEAYRRFQHLPFALSMLCTYVLTRYFRNCLKIHQNCMEKKETSNKVGSIVSFASGTMTHVRWPWIIKVLVLFNFFLLPELNQFFLAIIHYQSHIFDLLNGWYQFA